jgi:hypothetical protein
MVALKVHAKALMVSRKERQEKRKGRKVVWSMMSFARFAYLPLRPLREPLGPSVKPLVPLHEITVRLKISLILEMTHLEC